MHVTVNLFTIIGNWSGSYPICDMRQYKSTAYWLFHLYDSLCREQQVPSHGNEKCISYVLPHQEVIAFNMKTNWDRNKKCANLSLYFD